MSEHEFEIVLRWLAEERDNYQIEKFDYETEGDRPIEYWTQQFDNYIGRIPIFGINTPQGVQAALKLAATAVAFCEHLAAKNKLPRPGVSSGIIEVWEQ